MPGERILLVDDNAVNRKLTGGLLTIDGYQVTTSASAEDALAKISECRPQLVITDIRLTGMDGIEFTRCLRAIPEWKTVPIIALTGLNSDEDRQQATDAGCNAFLSKPVDSQVL